MKPQVIQNKMVQAFPTAKPKETVLEVEAMLVRHAKEFETINYIYVIDEDNRLIGTLSIKEIFSAPKNTVVETLMNTKIITAHFGTHQEKIANLALRHNLKAIPIVDKENKLLGIIPSDAIFRILHEEHNEDILRSAGVLISENQANDIISSSIFINFKKRMPWLIVGLGGGVLAAFMVSIFENTMKEILVLTAFIPAIVYMADAVGSQTQTIFIRSLAIEHSMGIRKFINREIVVGIAMALVLSIAIAVISFIWWSPPILGLILGLSFFATILTAVAIAILLPLFFIRIKIDPAIASGPFATVIRDILSLVIYFGIASMLM